MWLSKMLSKSSASDKAERGRITMSGSQGLEAGASVNARNITAYAPYGYCAAPPIGEEVILVPSSDGQVALGTKSGAGELEAGEIKIASRGGASIVLKNDGRIVINNTMIINSKGEIESGI